MHNHDRFRQAVNETIQDMTERYLNQAFSLPVEDSLELFRLRQEIRAAVCRVGTQYGMSMETSLVVADYAMSVTVLQFHHERVVLLP